MTNPIVAAAADELVAQLHGIAGDLPDEYRARAEELAHGVQLIAAEVVTGALSLERGREAARNLTLAAESLLAQSGLDLLKKRGELLAAGTQILLKVAVAAMA